MLLSRHLCVLLAALALANAAPVRVPFEGGAFTIDVASSRTFRLGVDLSASGIPPSGTAITTTRTGGAASPIASPAIDATATAAPSRACGWGGMTGLCTSFGALLGAGNGTILLLDAANATALSSSVPPTAKGDGIVLSVRSPRSALQGLPAQPCLSNGMFGPTHAWDRAAQVFALAVSAQLADLQQPTAQNVHCAPSSFTGAPAPAPTPAPRTDMCAAAVRQAGRDSDGSFKRVPGTSAYLVTSLDACCAACNKNQNCRAWIAAADLKPDKSGSNCWLGTSSTGSVPSANRVYAALPPPPTPAPAPGGDWWVLGSSADWYLAPTPAGAYEFAESYYALTGAPALPPRYALGFMATYWGWDKMSYVVGNMTRMRDGGYPIDAFIQDYDWWNCGTSPGDNKTECSAERARNASGQDFGYDGDMWDAEQTFNAAGSAGAAAGWPASTTRSAKDLFAYFHDGIGSEPDATAGDRKTLRMRWGGIRKPRAYSNVALSKDRGWMLPDKDAVGAGNNNWNYTVPSFLEWYSAGHEHFLRDGVDFWWNDEGETQWYTYYYWNRAQRDTWDAVRPRERMFTINRAFTPGMQRFPAVTWTGDMQDCSHKKALEFAVWGQPWFTCDLTSPTATVLLRQYQGAVWWPVMRVHQMHGVPRMPYYWGGEQHQAAFRAALHARYALIPTLYSLAHAQARPPHPPMVHPASFDFPDDPQDLTVTYAVGAGAAFIAADLSVSHGPDAHENCSTATLPALPGAGAQQWFLWNSTTTVGAGGRVVARDDLALDEFPVYVRSGTVSPVHPADRAVQHSAAQGGLLEVQVYAGADGAFDMYEDDGATTDYMHANTSDSATTSATAAAAGGAVRATRWRWDEAGRTLSWEASGPAAFAGGNDYTSVRVALFVANATGGPQRSAARTISTSGQIKM